MNGDRGMDAKPAADRAPDGDRALEAAKDVVFRCCKPMPAPVADRLIVHAAEVIREHLDREVAAQVALEAERWWAMVATYIRQDPRRRAAFPAFEEAERVLEAFVAKAADLIADERSKALKASGLVAEMVKDLDEARAFMVDLQQAMQTLGENLARLKGEA